MKHLRTVDVSTHAVTPVNRGTPLKAVVKTMRPWRISALPVVSDEGRVVGVVSEADPLLKAQGRNESCAVSAGQLTTAPAATVPRSAGVASAARLMAGHHLKRLPVVDDEGILVDAASRGDPVKIRLRPAEDIAQKLRELITTRLIPAGSAAVSVHVPDGGTGRGIRCRCRPLAVRGRCGAGPGNLHIHRRDSGPTAVRNTDKAAAALRPPGRRS
ncbi:HPP family protein [Streptomyces sp. NPDC101194]|uniref:CBS domain-containing protein n=1 Tax=Streptomyces sp. NPDC101194 TaxID=3366127 RepID=UPI003816425F